MESINCFVITPLLLMQVEIKWINFVWGVASSKPRDSNIVLSELSIIYY